MIGKIIKSVLRFMLAAFNSVIAGVVIISLVSFYAYRIEPNWIQVRDQPLYVQNLPQNFRAIKIVQISDLHGKNYIDDELVEKVNMLQPDIVAITGDIYDEEKNISLEYAAKALGGLRADYGVYYVLGNNDYYLGKSQIIKELKAIGIETLQNSSRKLTIQGQSIWLIGLEDPYMHKANLAKALTGVDNNMRILLAHSPAVFAEAVNNNIDLLLVGHTHGGQLSIPSIPEGIQYLKKSKENYIAGLYQEGRTQMYVNRGLGESQLPLRFLVRPEITVLTLHCQE